MTYLVSSSLKHFHLQKKLYNYQCLFVHSLVCYQNPPASQNQSFNLHHHLPHHIHHYLHHNLHHHLHHHLNHHLHHNLHHHPSSFNSATFKLFRLFLLVNFTHNHSLTSKEPQTNCVTTELLPNLTLLTKIGLTDLYLLLHSSCQFANKQEQT